MIRQERLDRISEWANNPEFLQEDLRSEEFILTKKKLKLLVVQDL